MKKQIPHLQINGSDLLSGAVQFQIGHYTDFRSSVIIHLVQLLVFRPDEKPYGFFISIRDYKNIFYPVYHKAFSRTTGKMPEKTAVDSIGPGGLS
jgi:hypothetical protein